MLENLEGEHQHRIDTLPPVSWSKRVVDSYFGVWTYKRSGKGAGSAVIRINKLLQAKLSVVSDDILKFVVYHEYLHHVLPFRGHDAEFRALEARWPDVDAIEADLDTLSDDYDLSAHRYRRR